MKYWATSDFTSACILRACGVPLLHLDKNNNRTVAFVFNSSNADCATLLKQHWDRKLILDTRLIFEIIAELKTRIYQELNNKEKQ